MLTRLKFIRGPRSLPLLLFTLSKVFQDIWRIFSLWHLHWRWSLFHSRRKKIELPSLWILFVIKQSLSLSLFLYLECRNVAMCIKFHTRGICASFDPAAKLVCQKTDDCSQFRDQAAVSIQRYSIGISHHVLPPDPSKDLRDSKHAGWTWKRNEGRRRRILDRKGKHPYKSSYSCFRSLIGTSALTTGNYLDCFLPSLPALLVPWIILDFFRSIRLFGK